MRSVLSEGVREVNGVGKMRGKERGGRTTCKSQFQAERTNVGWVLQLMGA